MSDSLVIIPTYNEKENIESMINTVLSLDHDFHILIVDDGSPDGTAVIVKRLQNNFKNRLFILERSGKQGLGTAYILGFKWGLNKSYDYIFEMDCDFSHNPLDLLRLYRSLKNNEGDLVIGSRYIKGGKLKNWPINRILLSKGASLYVRIITGLSIMDSTAGFVGYKKEVLESLNFDKIQFIGYAFQIEMKYSASKLGFRIKEIPITFSERERGHSKMSGSIVKEAILGVIKLRNKSNF